jgi:hypothetical protein
MAGIVRWLSIVDRGRELDGCELLAKAHLDEVGVSDRQCVLGREIFVNPFGGLIVRLQKSEVRKASFSNQGPPTTMATLGPLDGQPVSRMGKLLISIDAFAGLMLFGCIGHHLVVAQVMRLGNTLCPAARRSSSSFRSFAPTVVSAHSLSRGARPSP